MKVIVDEGVPRHLVTALRDRGIDASRFDPGFAWLSNGTLISAIEARGFDVLLTNDKNMAYQRSLDGRDVAIVALPLNRRRPLIDRIDDIADTIRRSVPGQHIVMERDGSRRVVRTDKDGQAIDDLPRLPPFEL